MPDGIPPGAPTVPPPTTRDQRPRATCGSRRRLRARRRTRRPRGGTCAFHLDPVPPLAAGPSPAGMSERSPGGRVLAACGRAGDPVPLEGCGRHGPAVGERRPERWAAAITAGESSAAVLADLPRPTFLERRTDPRAVAHRVAWGSARHRRRRALRAGGLPPSVIDPSICWRPPTTDPRSRSRTRAETEPTGAASSNVSHRGGAALATRAQVRSAKRLSGRARSA
jgi:hypothetical protein